MKTVTPVLLLVLFCAALSSCAQSKNIVVSKRGFFMVPTPGTIPVDGNGQPEALNIDSVFTLFIETVSSEIRWESGWKGNRSFSTIPGRVKDVKVVVGQSKEGNGKLELAAKKGNTLWHIELSDDQKRSKAPQPVSANEVLLKGFAKGKVFFVRVQSLTELVSPRYQ